VKQKSKTVPSKVLSSKFVGLYVSGACAGPGWSNPGYIHALYEDVLDTGAIRLRHGEAVREKAYARGAAYKAFVALYAEFAELAKTVSGKSDDSEFETDSPSQDAAGTEDRALTAVRRSR